jgi:Cu(I)/Ag(I) efflux system membrane fusion protein
MRMINTGVVKNDSTEIVSGIYEGDVVVASGAYLINSEYTFKHGATPMEGMEMGTAK